MPRSISLEPTNNFEAIGQFADELEVRIDIPKAVAHKPMRAFTLPFPKALPAPTSSSSTNIILHESHSEIALSSADLAFGSHTSCSSLLSSGVSLGLKKSHSLDNISGPPLFTLGYDDDEQGLAPDQNGVISISLADFDNFDYSRLTETCCYCRLAEKASQELLLDEAAESLKCRDADQSSASNLTSASASNTSLSSDNSKSDSTFVALDRSNACPSYSSLNATADISPPLNSTHSATEQPTDLGAQSSTDELSSNAPANPLMFHHHHSHRHNKHHFQHHRKKFVLKPQHGPLSTANQSEIKPLEYTTEIPETFKFGNKLSAVADSVASIIRRKVGKHPPPLLPPQLESTFINSSVRALKDEGNQLPCPHFVVLNHLATTSIKHEVLAVASTSRYRTKFRKYHEQVSWSFKFTNSFSHPSSLYAYVKDPMAAFIKFIYCLQDLNVTKKRHKEKTTQLF